MKKVLLFILCPMFLFGQTQIGQDINGQGEINFFGTSVSLSSDGNIVAIGAIGNNDNGNLSGQVSIYGNNNNVWEQIGSDIKGDVSGDKLGTSVSLSSDGSIVAIGVTGNDGNGSNSGHVRVYQNINNVWTQIGQDIDGESSDDLSGTSIGLSSDGNIVAIGAIWNDGNGSNSGHVRVYQNINNVWTQIGQDIDGEGLDDEFGDSLCLSLDGNIVAIGAPLNDGNGSNSGHVRVYQNINNVWTQIGQDINGENKSDYLGDSISLSSDGNIIAIGATGNDGNGNSSGHTRIYRNNGGIWEQIGLDINGEAEGDISGVSLSLSSNGSIVAIGATSNDGNGDRSGHLRVYDLSQVLSTEKNTIDNNFNLYPNPATNQIKIQLNNSNLNQVFIFNNLGQLVKTSKKSKINTANLSKGIYFVEVKTNQGKSTKKLIIE